jgi:hypothetical protein
MAAPDLTTTADVKAWLGITNTDFDTLLTRLITAASVFAQTYMQRQIASASYTEKRSGVGSAVLMVRNTPMTAVASVTVDNIAIPAAANSLLMGYTFDENEIYLNGYEFARGRNNIQLAYTAGFATVPQDIAQATIELVSLKFKEKDRIGLVSKGLAGETTAYTQKDMQDSVKSCFDIYKRILPV